jgi:DNA-binding CsgD family transcriptional regulator
MHQHHPRLKAPLSPRQQECLAHASRGASAKEIGRTLGISPETVYEHLELAYRRLGASGRTQALALARRRGLLAHLTEPSDT